MVGMGMGMNMSMAMGMGMGMSMGMGMGMGMGAGLRSAASMTEDYVSPPKYKSSLLHRYLNDSLRHVMVANAVMDARKRNHSGSFSSNEYDDELLSPSSSEAEANFVYRAGKEPHFLHSFPFKSLPRTHDILHFCSFFVPSICTFCFNSCSWSNISNTLFSPRLNMVWILLLLKWRCGEEDLFLITVLLDFSVSKTKYRTSTYQWRSPCSVTSHSHTRTLSVSAVKQRRNSPRPTPLTRL